MCKEDENVLNDCRDNFKKLEEKDPYCVEIWKKFRELSLKEFQKVYDLLGSKFDSWNGESFYSDKMPEIIDILNKSGKLIESQGARIIDLEDKGINTPCIIEKSNGSTTYATRDLAAIMYRARTYNFDKALYVTSYEQTLHFKQVFEVAKLLVLDEKYTNGLEHVSFGMVLLPTGKMSTREGNVVKLEELLNEAISRAKDIIEQKNPELEDKEEVSKKVGIGAVIFNDLSGSRIKDEIFDWDTILNFQGETGPYIQYTYVRTKSVLEKAGYTPKFEDVKIEKLLDEYSLEILKLIYNFEDILIQVTEKNEPSMLSRYLIDLAKAYSSFYNENKIIVEDKENVLTKKISEAYNLNLNNKTSFAKRVEKKIKEAINPKLKEHQSRNIYSIDCRGLRRGDTYGWLSAIAKESIAPIVVIEYVTQIPDGDRTIYDDPNYVANLLLRSWKNDDIYVDDLHIDRRKFTVILTCPPEDIDILQRECGLCSYSWIGDFEERHTTNSKENSNRIIKLKTNKYE